MARIVYASSLRKRLGSPFPKPLVSLPFLLLLMLTLGSVSLGAASGRLNLDEVVEHYIPIEVGTPFPQIVSPSDIAAAAQEERMRIRAADYIASSFRIAREASQYIAMEAFLAAREHSVDPLLLLSIIGVESGFNPISVSSVGAMGLTQALPRAHPEKMAFLARNQGHILTISDNIRVGARILSEYLRKFQGNTVKALQQYNGSLHDPEQTYSRKVLRLRARLNEAAQSRV